MFELNREVLTMRCLKLRNNYQIRKPQTNKWTKWNKLLAFHKLFWFRNERWTNLVKTVKIIGVGLPLWDKETSSLGNVYLPRQ